MEEKFTKLTDEIAAKIAERFETKEMQDFISATKAAEDSGSFEVVISTGDVDRDGEIIDQNGWDFALYRMNPIVLWAHDYGSLPIGITEDIRIEGNQTIAKGKFAPESANPFAQQVRRLYDLKIVRATSVGFIARDMNGNTITKAELMEFSFVPVPANPYALSILESRKLNAGEFIAKGILKEEKQGGAQPVEGEACTMSDGSIGVYARDEDTGQIVCEPKVEEKPKSAAVIKEELLRHEEEIKTAVVVHTQKILDAIGAAGEGKDASALVGKVGRVLSEKSRSLIKSAIEQIKATAAALEELLVATDPQGSEGEEAADGQSSKQRSSSAGFVFTLEDFDEFLETRKILRLVNTATSQALEKINKRPLKKPVRK